MMKSIQVNSLPFKEVISDIAEAFGTDYSKNCDEYILQLPSHIGSGTIKGINFTSGLGIINYDCTFNEDLEIQFVVNEIHPLKFLYCIEGVLQHRFGNAQNLHEIEQYQKAIVASSDTIGHVLCFKADIKVVVSSLEIARKEFSEKIKCELRTMDEELQILFTDVQAEKEFYHDGFYSLQLADTFHEIHSFEESDFLKKLFLEGKAYQMLTKQILEYQDDLKDVDHRNILRKSEIRLIEKAATILRRDISNTETIQALSRRVGLNPNKLQEGFRYIYRKTVNQYVHDIRLENAKEYLINTDFSINEIVGKIGLTSASYFSKIFKQKYGITPSKFRLQYITGLKKRSLQG